MLSSFGTLVNFAEVFAVLGLIVSGSKVVVRNMMCGFRLSTKHLYILYGKFSSKKIAKFQGFFEIGL